MDFDDVINKRYSVRGYLDKEVEDEKLEYVLKAATIAPTGVNNQPFKVFVIDTKKNKESLSEIYGWSEISGIWTYTFSSTGSLSGADSGAYDWEIGEWVLIAKMVAFLNYYS